MFEELCAKWKQEAIVLADQRKQLAMQNFLFQLKKELCMYLKDKDLLVAKRIEGISSLHAIRCKPYYQRGFTGVEFGIVKRDIGHMYRIPDLMDDVREAINGYINEESFFNYRPRFGSDYPMVFPITSQGIRCVACAETDSYIEIYIAVKCLP